MSEPAKPSAGAALVALGFLAAAGVATVVVVDRLRGAKTKAAADAWTDWKIDAHGSDVKILRRDRDTAKVEQILAGFPRGSDHRAVSRALKAIGAEFVSWDDGAPGWSGLYR